MTQLFLTSFVQYMIDADTWLSLGINSFHCAFLDVFLYIFSAKTVWALFYAGLVYMVIRNYSWKMSLILLVSVALIIFLCDQVASSWLRPIIARLRPCDPDNPISPMVHLVDGYRPVSFSCPSAHGANSFGLAVFIALLFRRKWLSWCLFFWVAITCYSRIYLGVHYLSDFLFGMLIGAVISVVVYAILRSIPQVRLSLDHVKGEQVSLAALALTIAAMATFAAVKPLFS